MAAGAAKMWEALCQAVVRCACDDTAFDSLQGGILDGCEALDDAPPAPRAAWKRLLQQQVPEDILHACVQLMSTQSMPQTYVALNVAVTVLRAAQVAGLVPFQSVSSSSTGSRSSSSSTGSSSSSSSSKGRCDGTQGVATNARAASFNSQLLRSGLQRAVPVLLKYMVQQLRQAARAAAVRCSAAEAAAAAAATAEGSSRPSAGTQGAAGTGQVQSTRQQQQQQQQQQELMLAAAQLHWLVRLLHLKLLDPLPDKHGLRIALFDIAGLQYVDSILQQQQQQQGAEPLSSELQGLLSEAANSSNCNMHMLMCQMLGKGACRKQQLPSLGTVFLHSWCWQLTTALLVPLVQQAEQDAGDRRRTSSSSSDAAAEWLPGRLSSSVPVPVRKLLQQLGCSSELALWTVQECLAKRPDWFRWQMERLMESYLGYNDWQALPETAAALQQYQHLPCSQQLSQARMQTHLLLPAALLHWLLHAAHPGCEDMRFVYKVLVVVRLALTHAAAIMHGSSPADADACSSGGADSADSSSTCSCDDSADSSSTCSGSGGGDGGSSGDGGVGAGSGDISSSSSSGCNTSSDGSASSGGDGTMDARSSSSSSRGANTGRDSSSSDGSIASVGSSSSGDGSTSAGSSASGGDGSAGAGSSGSAGSSDNDSGSSSMVGSCDHTTTGGVADAVAPTPKLMPMDTLAELQLLFGRVLHKLLARWHAPEQSAAAHGAAAPGAASAGAAAAAAAGTGAAAHLSSSSSEAGGGACATDGGSSSSMAALLDALQSASELLLMNSDQLWRHLHWLAETQQQQGSTGTGAADAGAAGADAATSASPGATEPSRCAGDDAPEQRVVQMVQPVLSQMQDVLRALATAVTTTSNSSNGGSSNGDGSSSSSGGGGDTHSTPFSVRWFLGLPFTWCLHTEYLTQFDDAGRWMPGVLVAPLLNVGDNGSPAALHLFGLCVTFLKLRAALQPHAGTVGPLLQGRCDTYLKTVCMTACHMLSTHITAAPDAAAPAGAAGSGSSSSAGAGDSSCGDGWGRGSGSDAPAALHWLVLLGRCCLQLAGVLQQELSAAQQAQQTRQSSAPGQQAAASGPSESAEGCGRGGEAGEGGVEPVWLQNVRSWSWVCSKITRWMVDWGTDARSKRQLVAAGYHPMPLLQQLNLLQVARGTWLDYEYKGLGNPVTVAAALAQQLVAFGEVLSAFAVPHACNNPHCSNLSGPSEAALVGGRSCVCAGCRTARYCSKQCQRQHWQQHKPMCRALAGVQEGVAVDRCW